MSTVYIHKNVPEVEEAVEAIIFAEGLCRDNYEQAFSMEPDSYSNQKYIRICDYLDCVIINSKEHALNLIKALNKAIELGWIE